MGGQIIDASLIAAPKQRNNDDEKEAIKEGKNAAEIGTVVNFVLGAILTPMEGAYGNQEGHTGSASGRA